MYCHQYAKRRGILSSKSCTLKPQVLKLWLLYLVTPKSHIGGDDESNAYNFKWWTLVKSDHPVQIQWAYRPLMVYGKQEPRQHILLSHPGFAQKDLWGSGRSGCCRPETGSYPNSALGDAVTESASLLMRIVISFIATSIVCELSRYSFCFCDAV